MNILQRNDSVIVNTTSNPAINIIYAVIGSSAIIGNVFVIALNVIHRPMLRQIPNKFVVSLAASDAISGVIIFIMPGYALPVDRYFYPKDIFIGSFFCSLIDSSVLFFTSGFISVYTIAIISLERWYAVSRPFLYKRIFTKNRARFCIACIWLFVPITLIDGILQKRFVPNLFPPCQWFSLFGDDITSANIVFMIIESVRIFLPVIITMISFADVARRMSDGRDIKLSVSNSMRVLIRRRFTTMLCIAAIALILCWLPNEIYFTLVQLRVVKYEPIVHAITKTLIVINCCINPIIYAATNSIYRQGMIRLLHRIGRCIRCKNAPAINPAGVGSPRTATIDNL
ncbi:uncharacterized protein TRIADDRAFT_55924 [Trichoplax adhaerens]|uniref:G-protein coupled receptors family 1 profile domain-containing protein n=1 Tax=Trichoplax adhaerens TaxID=10228 RepID=B3RTH2_TRIAD|nr:hypothetical protein TRIADDRAFT_55924 [Trichoplax adhaerens]EDV25628.1 hypothetical protein TRIADDRAFT_55924 [Trichoplax adhaerens]|eukprot:XP_002111661.1 hypothetical protein TRIADDRAFT_55924 [Trichoplax adhaerens]